MTTSFTVCSYNMGSDIRDFSLAYRLSHPEGEEKDNLEQLYREREEATAKKLSNQHVDVFCLQEVNRLDRPLIQKLTSEGSRFGLHYIQYKNGKIDRSIDAVIILDKTRFTNIKSHSFNSECPEEACIVTATDSRTNQQVAFVSVHVPGFKLAKNGYTIPSSDTLQGDNTCARIINLLNQIGPCAVQIIGADMNINPEIYESEQVQSDGQQAIRPEEATGGCRNRFKILENQRFNLHRTNKPTARNNNEPTYPEREIDFIFSRVVSPRTIWQKIILAIKSVFFQTLQNQLAISRMEPLSWEENASDHLPVFITVTPSVPSKISQAWRAFRSCF